MEDRFPAWDIPNLERVGSASSHCCRFYLFLSRATKYAQCFSAPSAFSEMNTAVALSDTRGRFLLRLSSFPPPCPNRAHLLLFDGPRNTYHAVFPVFRPRHVRNCPRAHNQSGIGTTKQRMYRTNRHWLTCVRFSTKHETEICHVVQMRRAVSYQIGAGANSELQRQMEHCSLLSSLQDCPG